MKHFNSIKGSSLLECVKLFIWPRQYACNIVTENYWFDYKGKKCWLSKWVCGWVSGWTMFDEILVYAYTQGFLHLFFLNREAPNTRHSLPLPTACTPIEFALVPKLHP